MHEEADSDQNGSDESDIECGAAVAAYPKSSNESIDMNSSHGLLSDNRNSDSEIFEDSLQFVQLNPLIDSELLGTAEIQNVILVEDAVQRKLESRRMEILKMRTHGAFILLMFVH